MGFGHREWLVSPMLTMSSNRLAWGIESSLKLGGQVVEKCLYLGQLLWRGGIRR